MEKTGALKGVKGTKAKKAAGTALIVSLFAILILFGRHPLIGDSMEPAYHDGQTVYTIRALRSPQKGDVVIAYSPDLSELLIKRVAGTPGDTVEITQDGEVLINGQPYAYGIGNGIAASMDGMEASGDGSYRSVLGEREYFLLGDNREFSGDSRQYGPFKRAAILESVIYVH